jgi:hypothetical protein
MGGRPQIRTIPSKEKFHGTHRIHHARTRHHRPDFALTDVVTGKTVIATISAAKGAARPLHLHPLPLRQAHRERSRRAGQGLRRQTLAIVAISSNDVTTHPATAPPDSSSRPKHSASSFLISMTKRRPWPRLQSRLHAGHLSLRRDFDSSIAASSMRAGPATEFPSPAKISAPPSIRCLPASPFPRDQRPSIGCNIKWKA